MQFGSGGSAAVVETSPVDPMMQQQFLPSEEALRVCPPSLPSTACARIRFDCYNDKMHSHSICLLQRQDAITFGLTGTTTGFDSAE